MTPERWEEERQGGFDRHRGLGLGLKILVSLIPAAIALALGASLMVVLYALLAAPLCVWSLGRTR